MPEREIIHIHHHHYHAAPKAHPLTHLLRPFVKNLDTNPRWQLAIHVAGFWYWTINFPLITYMFVFHKAWWNEWGLFITLLYSIYANWTSDYTGMSAAQAVINTMKKFRNKVRRVK